MDNFNEKSLKAQAWKRFWARMFDLFLFGFVFMVITIHLRILQTHPIYYFIAQTLFTITLEAIFIWQNSTTPGKKFLGMYVVSSDNRKLTLAETWYRTFWVYVKGIWLGIPVMMFVPAWFSRNAFVKNGITIWDLAARTEIVEYPSSLFRKVIFGFIFILLMFLIGNYTLLLQGIAQAK